MTDSGTPKLADGGTIPAGQFAYLGTPDRPEQLGTPDWTPEPRPTAAELLPDFEPVRHPKPATVFASWAEQLDAATFDVLRQLANGGTGDPA